MREEKPIPQPPQGIGGKGTKLAIKPIDEVRGTLDLMAPQFKMVLPATIPVERFMRVAMTAINNNKHLLECDRNSLYAACMLAAQDQLLPDGRQGAIVPFGGKATWMPMVGGILTKIRNSGELLSLHPDIIYQGDAFNYWIDENGVHLKHLPNFDVERSESTMIAAYAMARTKDGGVYVEVMSRAEIEKVQRVSRSRGGPWQEWQAEMWKKTVIRRLSKRLPMSTDADDLVRREDKEYAIEGTEIHTALPASKSGLKRLEAIVGVPSGVDSAPQSGIRQPDSHAGSIVESSTVEGPFPFEKEPKKG